MMSVSCDGRLDAKSAMSSIAASESSASARDFQ
jgi:hypothetical protein